MTQIHMYRYVTFSKKPICGKVKVRDSKSLVSGFLVAKTVTGILVLLGRLFPGEGEVENQVGKGKKVKQGMVSVDTSFSPIPWEHWSMNCTTAWARLL